MMVSLMLLVAGCTASPDLAVASSVTMEPEVPGVAVPARFWDHWGDGRAELSGYRLRTPRYGQLRDGRATLVFVTERFTHEQRVKSDGRHADEYPVLKVNVVRDFQTGIYDYNVMSSSFHRVGGRHPGRPVKVSMSMQEWCGHVYEQVIPYEDRTMWTSHSYFDGEADRTLDLGMKPGGVYEDALPVMVRGLFGPIADPGANVTMPVLPTLESGRIRHQQPSWTTMTFSRDAAPVTVTVPAGTFEVEVVKTALRGGGRTTWYVERAWPHRLVKWTRDDGEVAEMLGSERLPYWNQSGNGNEAQLEKLGLPHPTSVW